MSNIAEVFSVGAELFHAEGQTGGYFVVVLTEFYVIK
jgi:hypothetical protein